MWDDLEQDAKDNARQHGPQCGTGIMLDVIREENGREALDAVLHAFANHRLTTSSIHKALEKRVEPDLLPTVYSLRHHRNGRCRCKKEES